MTTPANGVWRGPREGECVFRRKTESGREPGNEAERDPIGMAFNRANAVVEQRRVTAKFVDEEASHPELWDDIVQIPEYLSADQPGGFFWMGPAGTVTPFHHDLTNNFMAQVIGRKRIKLAPSWDLPAMHNHKHCFSQVDGRVAPPGSPGYRGSADPGFRLQLRRDSLPAHRLLPLRRGSRYLGHCLLHQLRFRQRLLQLLFHVRAGLALV